MASLSWSLTLLLACFLAGMSSLSGAKNHKINWIIPYPPNPQSVTLKKGDTVTLRWSKAKQPHDIKQFPGKKTFDGCVFKKNGKPIEAMVAAAKSGRKVFKWASDKKTIYLGCSVGASADVGGHCKAGQKVAIFSK